jgi:hypothetical protein
VNADMQLAAVPIFFCGTPSSDLDHLRHLAGCLGIDAVLVDIDTPAFCERFASEVLAAPRGSAVLDAASLARGCSQDGIQDLLQLLLDNEIRLLVLARLGDDVTTRFLRTLLGRDLAFVELPSSDSPVSFTRQGRLHSRELAGHSYPRAVGPAIGLDRDSSVTTESVMTIGTMPTFSQISLGRTTAFLWCTPHVFNVMRPLRAEIEFETASDQYVPFMMFLRAAFGDQCWHSASVGADLIIDDPLLRRTYGFVDFAQLLPSARQHKYHVTVAFIPWNWWRSRAKHSRLFVEHASCFSVCVHGCDHTQNEFASPSYEDLLGRAFVATERMRRHERSTGIKWDPVMVCPQERYSLEALQALAASKRFIAVANSACIPRNLTEPRVRGADLLLPAQDAFFGLPILKRHYSNAMPEFAMGLFLGKPAVLAAHHELFKGGAAAIERFVADLKALRSDIQWMSTDAIAMGTHLQRRAPGNLRELRFFTDTFQFLPSADGPACYRAMKRLPRDAAVSQVLLNGRRIPHRRDGDLLTVEFTLERAEPVRIDIESPLPAANVGYQSGAGYQLSVAMRRALSEFRDNVIARYGLPLKIARFLARATGQSA